VVENVVSCVVEGRGVMKFLNEVFENVAVIIHDGGSKGCCNFSNGGVVVVEESIFQGHKVVADEIVLASDEESGLWCGPNVPVEE